MKSVAAFRGAWGNRFGEAGEKKSEEKEELSSKFCTCVQGFSASGVPVRGMSAKERKNDRQTEMKND
jgi:hypothetical protein